MSDNNAIKLNPLLAPIAPLYGIGAGLRNILFSWGIIPSVEFSVPVIGMGNLSVGGTGKTPHTEYLVKMLKQNYRIAVLSRGYKRTTKGFLIANQSSDAQSIGDEAFQMYLRHPDVTVAVAANRKRAITSLLERSDKPEIILLDDAYQHRYVTPSLSILLTDFHRLFYKDQLLPWGKLREAKAGMHRADAIIVTKCIDSLHPIDYRIIESEMKLFSHQQLFFTKIVYENIRPVFTVASGMHANPAISDSEVLLIAGIASPALFIKEVEQRFSRITSMIFPDHHSFDKHDIAKINESFARLNSTDKFILTTEKDAVRLLCNPLIPQEWKDILYYLPIRIEFCNENSVRFNDWLRNHIITFQRNNILH
ncbi:MAG: tetraacyldisaccharide 4'-kinase [Tannerellaceae bacterium]|jgi:tetraacyldisaccharide 4'-kinase|nr:tetraacyldisaccharide 4'-kinase [Tannerellaceae bacterium]